MLIALLQALKYGGCALQWNPVTNSWGSPYWGHVASSNLVFWKRLPPALVPDTPYDLDGCFSGSAAFHADGTPLLLYTGKLRLKLSEHL